MVTPTVFFRANRLWWSSALVIGPIIGAVARDMSAGFIATMVLVLPAFVIFDTDRPWWPPAIRDLPGNSSEATRAELRKITRWSVASLVMGVAIAIALSVR